MLSEKFITRLTERFPEFHARVDAEARERAARLTADAKGDLTRALLAARVRGSLDLWWPYVKGSVPVVGDSREAMEGFTRLVLTVDHLVGQAPPTMEAARDHVASVLRESLDVERLVALVERQGKAEVAAEGAGLVATASALMAPLAHFRRARRFARFIPVPLRVALVAVIVAALASIPLVAGYSAGLKAEEAARAATLPPAP